MAINNKVIHSDIHKVRNCRLIAEEIGFWISIQIMQF